METQSYLTNLPDAEWHLLEPLLPPPARIGGLRRERCTAAT
jgi:hypothetical protein